MPIRISHEHAVVAIINPQRAVRACGQERCRDVRLPRPHRHTRPRAFLAFHNAMVRDRHPKPSPDVFGDRPRRVVFGAEGQGLRDEPVVVHALQPALRRQPEIAARRGGHIRPRDVGNDEARRRMGVDAVERPVIPRHGTGVVVAGGRVDVERGSGALGAVSPMRCIGRDLPLDNHIGRTKTIQSQIGGNPNIALSVFVQITDLIGGQPVAGGEGVQFS